VTTPLLFGVGSLRRLALFFRSEEFTSPRKNDSPVIAPEATRMSRTRQIISVRPAESGGC
jgi:hypothetical protein